MNEEIPCNAQIIRTYTVQNSLNSFITIKENELSS